LPPYPFVLPSVWTPLQKPELGVAKAWKLPFEQFLVPDTSLASFTAQRIEQPWKGGQRR
jgi:hypothetical protein